MPASAADRWLCEALDADDLPASNRIAEIGRFAIVPGRRRYLLLAMALMRAVTREACSDLVKRDGAGCRRRGACRDRMSRRRLQGWS